MNGNKILCSLLKEFFQKAKITLPRRISVLDIGAGRWEYAKALQQFLKSYQMGKGKRTVRLVGIDPLGAQLCPRVPRGALYHSLDVFQLKEKRTYDMVFLIHPFPEYRQIKHGLSTYSPKKFFAKVISLLRKDGYVFGIAYGAPREEYALFDSFPKKNLILLERYNNEQAMKHDYAQGRDTYSNSMVLIGKK